MPQYTSEQVRAWLDEIRSGRLQLNEDNMGLADAAMIMLRFDVPYPSPAKLPEGYLTPHFTLAELTRSGTAQSLGLSNDPSPQEIDHLLRTCNALEKIRIILGDRPITITSAFRSEAVNNAVGGVPNSAHRLGLAADFVCPGFGTPQEIAASLERHMQDLDLDQLIYENKGGGQWVHIGLSEGVPRYMALTITDAGTVNGIV